jgi:hypothetical protein
MRTASFSACCRKAAIVGLLPLLLAGIAGPSYAQQAFSSSEAAATAFAGAVASSDHRTLGKALGP